VLSDAKVLAQHDAEVLLGRAVGRPVVVGQVKVGDAAVEGAADHGAASLEDVGAAKVLPQAERDGRQHQAGAATAAEDGVLVTVRRRQILLFHELSPI